MLAIGMVIVLVGYGLAYTGKQMWDGCNPNIIDVFWPGKYTPCSGTPSTSSSTSGNTPIGNQGTLQGSGLTTAQQQALSRLGPKVSG